MFPEIFRDDVFRIETPRLWLRWPTARDETAIERLVGDVAERTAVIPHPYPKGAAGSFIYAARVGNAQGSALAFALAPIARPQELLGIVSLHQEDGVPTLGYWLGKPFWGRGLMSEAVGRACPRGVHVGRRPGNRELRTPRQRGLAACSRKLRVRADRRASRPLSGARRIVRLRDLRAAPAGFQRAARRRRPTRRVGRRDAARPHFDSVKAYPAL